MSKGPTIEGFRRGISLQGSKSGTVRRASVEGFPIGINGDYSEFLTLEDIKVTLSAEDIFIISLSKKLPDLTVAQAISAKYILREFHSDNEKARLNLGKIVSTSAGFVEEAIKIYRSIFERNGFRDDALTYPSLCATFCYT
jgi:hypothetical protein